MSGILATMAAALAGLPARFGDRAADRLLAGLPTAAVAVPMAALLTGHARDSAGRPVAVSISMSADAADAAGASTALAACRVIASAVSVEPMKAIPGHMASAMPAMP